MPKKSPPKRSGRGGIPSGSAPSAKRVVSARVPRDYAVRYGSVFLSFVSHELRTSLTSILGFTEILLDLEDLTEAQRRYCEKIERSGRQLNFSLNHLVDLARIECGAGPLFIQEFSLSSVFADSCAAVERQAEKSGVRISFSTENEFAQVRSDESRIRQAICIFLGYAVGRSEQGLHVSVAGRTSFRNLTVVEICDEGARIAKPQAVFDEAAARSVNCRTATLGDLGLLVARDLLQAIGGRVRIQNRRPRGIRIRIEVPSHYETAD